MENLPSTKFSRITPEQAQAYIPVEEDVMGSEARFYTITPHRDIDKQNDGWEEVTYYTGRRKVMKIIPSVDKQHVYVLSNPSMPGLLKIGYTKGDPSKRVSQLDRSTSVPTGFVLEWAFPCYNGIELEGEVHEYLSGYRVNNQREFFKIPLEEVKSIIEKLGQKYNG